MSVLTLAAAHLRRQVALARQAARDVTAMWSQSIDRKAIASSWTATIPAVRTVVETAQAIAAASAGPYLDDTLDEYGLSPESVGRVRVDAFAGVASDGRPLTSLLYQPVVASLLSIRRGESEARALATGRFALESIVRTQVADAGRVADQVAIVARPQLSGWVRMLTLPSCARCALLAGRVYRWNAGFQRHPMCDCRAIPATEDAADDLTTDPRAFFDSLPTAEQDRIFTQVGAEAIRSGADIGRVVNARRGMYTAGGRRLTTEATTRRGINRKIRLMPEQIFAEAGGNRDEALRLLRLHGYLT